MSNVGVGKAYIELSDFERAHRELPALGTPWRMHTWARRSVAAWGVALMLYGLVTEGTFVLLLGVIFAVVGALAVLHQRGALRRAYDTAPSWQRDVRYSLSEDGLAYKTPKTAVEFAWDQFHAWAEGDKAFYLSQGQQCFILPKRGFEAPDQIEAVRAFLATRAFGLPPTTSPFRFGPGRLVMTLVLWLLLIGAFVVIYQLVTPPAPP